LVFYWHLGADIVAKQADSTWGDGLIDQLSKDLMSEFPDMKGFSRTNLMYMKKWYLFYSQSSAIVPQAVGQSNNTPLKEIFRIPWGHNREIVTNCKNVKEAMFYVQNTIKYNWSRSVLVHHIESNLYKREGKSPNNFTATLPAPQSDLAEQTLKDPYIFDFLTLTKEHKEKELEDALVEHITKFLLELGAGFAYVGRQFPLRVGKSDFFIDLLFYHLKLHCYIVIELKATAFQPEFAGKLNFYLSAVDSQVKSKDDNPSIGIILCKNKDQIIAEYALRNMAKPMGVSEYKLSRAIPAKLRKALPSAEQLETELEKKQ